MWDTPPISKIYEALGAVADNRIEINDDEVKCFSSSGNKYYVIKYDPTTNAIMTNDNGSYWKGYLGYPAIAFLLKIEVLPYQPELGRLLAGISWKDINQKFNNDFDRALEHILESLDPDAREKLDNYTSALLQQIINLKLQKLGQKIKPPAGY